MHPHTSGDPPSLNAVAWFSTHMRTASVDFTASNLIDHWAPPTRTALGEAWKNATPCPACACPGPDCR